MNPSTPHDAPRGTPHDAPHGTPHGTDHEPLTVLYDGACPLCRREIAHVQRLSQRQGDGALCFLDVSAAAAGGPMSAPGRSQALIPEREARRVVQ